MLHNASIQCPICLLSVSLITILAQPRSETCAQAVRTTGHHNRQSLMCSAAQGNEQIEWSKVIRPAGNQLPSHWISENNTFSNLHTIGYDLCSASCSRPHDLFIILQLPKDHKWWMLKAKLMMTAVNSLHIRRVFFIQMFCERTPRNSCRMNQK